MARRPIPTKKLAEKWRRPSVADDVKICTICNSELIEPRTLPCMHSFCEECIFVLLRCYEAQKKLDRTFLCPTCRVRTPCHILGKMHHDWLTMFPKKSAIDKMKEAIIVVEEMCHPCSKTWTVTQAIKFCVDCQEYFCETCGSDHVTNAGTKNHNTVEYEVKKMKNTPIANISKFQCKIHSSLRYASFCELHQVYLCNTCKEAATHRNCRLTHRVIESTGNITKAETKINVINSLKRDERTKGKQLLKMIDQIDSILNTLSKLRKNQIEAYCRYVVQASITEQKTEAIDALKGKLEFVKIYQPHETINNTMNKIEDILTGYVSMFAEIVDAEDKIIRSELNKSIADIEKVQSRPVFDILNENKLSNNGTDKEKPRNGKVLPIINPDMAVSNSEYYHNELHVCKRHVDDTLDEETFMRLGALFQSVGAICYGKMSATAFRVGTKYVMTAAHTVRDIVDPERTGKPEWNLLEDPAVYLSFDSPLTEHAQRFHLCQLVSFLDDKLNIAVLEVYEYDSLPPPVTLSRKDIDLVKVNEVAVMGYGHRGSHSKHLDTKCALIKPDSDRAKQALKWLKIQERNRRCELMVDNQDTSSLNWNYNEMKSSSHVTIDCCMEYRGLGAPVITNTGPSGAEVLAIITGSLPECYTDMPKKTQDGCKAYRFELGTKMSHLYQKLFVETRVVADDIFTKEKNYQLYDYDMDILESGTSSASLSFLASTPRMRTAESTEYAKTIRTSTSTGSITTPF